MQPLHSLHGDDVALSELYHRHAPALLTHLRVNMDSREDAEDLLAASRVDILDASSGQTVYTYTGNRQNISVLAWSPNGKYLVSGEALGTANVWTAE